VANGVATVVIKDLGKAPMPVFLVLTLADESTVEYKIPVEAWLGDASVATRVTVPVSAKVIKAEIDPQQYFPDLNRSNNVWKNQ
jgi:hypothetical protein